MTELYYYKVKVSFEQNENYSKGYSDERLLLFDLSYN